jgi:two-component system cell cycle sensor histidine kinase/response regulator CckA
MSEPTANILIVDDDTKTLMAMDALLAAPGRNIVLAKSGREALRHLLKQDFSLILLDVRMPDIDGFETAAMIRQNERFRYTPIIFLSAVDTLDEDVMRGVSSGAVDYMFKPVVPDVLRAKVSVFVDLFRMNERLKQQAVKEAQALLAAVVESSQDAIISKNLEGVILSWNTGAERLFGYKDAEVIGKPVTLMIPEKNHEEERLILERIRHGDRIAPFETIRRSKDGRTIDISLTISPILDGAGRIIGASSVARDITERKRMEAQLRELNGELEKRVADRTSELIRTIEQREKLQQQLSQSQKMESIGTLAGGIAHDFNNILTIILGYSSSLEGSNDAAKVREGLEVIRETGLRGAVLVQQLLTLARNGNLSFQPVDVNDLLRQFARLLSETFPKTTAISIEVDAGIEATMADPNRLHQALLNLCVNARDAMNGSGTLLLSDGSTSGAELRTRFPDADGEHYIRITVADTGTGMEPTIRDRIFDPFFTTKGPGKGTGLGLTAVYGILREHDGFVEVDSEPGRGTTFNLYLPLRSVDGKPVVAARGAKTNGAEHRGGHETLLFVDDEERQVELIEDFLTKNGYRVLVARDGVEAVEVHGRHKHEIAAVILDLGLPRLNGWEAFQKIKQQQPEVKTIFTSGYIKADLRSEMINQGVAAIIHKPYLPDELLGKIGAAINESAAVATS